MGLTQEFLPMGMISVCFAASRDWGGNRENVIISDSFWTHERRVEIVAHFAVFGRDSWVGIEYESL